MPGEINRMDGNERFRQLVHNGNPTVLGNLLSELGLVEAKKLIEECYKDQAETALVYSTKRAGDGKHRKDGDHLECVKLLISYGAQVNETDSSRRTALHWSCWYNNEPLSTLLLDNGADSSLPDDTGCNCLHTAVMTGALDCVRLVLGRRKELLNRRGGENGVTPLLAAVQKGDTTVVSALVTSGADVNAQEDTSKRTPLHYALYTRKRDLFEYLLQHGADITKTDHRGTTIIHRCCTIQDANFLKSVLSFGRTLPRRLSTHSALSVAHTATPLGTALQMGDGEGATPVIVACQNGNLEQLTLLVEAGAPVSNKDKFQRCALHHCVENPDTDCAEYLLRAIPSLLSCADEEGLTPLHMAVIAGNVPLVKLLLKRGANLKVVDNEKHTVVHWATETYDRIIFPRNSDEQAAHCATVSGSPETIDILRQHKVDLWIRNLKGDLPVHEAAQAGHIDLVKYLLDHSDGQTNVLDVGNRDGRTCLHVASLTNNVWLSKMLVERGANVNAIMQNKGKYYSPYDVALIKGHSEAKDYLYQQGGRPGNHVTSQAATTIQVRYKYHQNRDRFRRKRKSKNNDEKKEDSDSKKSLATKEESDGEEQNKEEEEKDNEEGAEDERVESQERIVESDSEKKKDDASVAIAPEQSSSTAKKDGKDPHQKHDIENQDKTRESRGKKKSSSRVSSGGKNRVKSSETDRTSEKLKDKGANNRKGEGEQEQNLDQPKLDDPAGTSQITATEPAESKSRPKSGKAAGKSSRSPRGSSSSPSPSPSPPRKRRTPTSPKYVEKGTQITTGATEVRLNGETLEKSQITDEKPLKSAEAKKSVEGSSEGKESSLSTSKEEEPQALSQSSSADKKKKSSKREKEPSEKHSSKKSTEKTRPQSSPSSVPSTITETASQPKTSRSNKTVKEESTKRAASPETKHDLNGHSKGEHKSKADYSSDFESERSYRSSSSSSSHSATSDIDSSSSERATKTKVKRSQLKRTSGPRPRQVSSSSNQPYSSDEEEGENKAEKKDSGSSDSKTYSKKSRPESKSTNETIPSKKASTSSSRSSKSSKGREEKVSSNSASKQPQVKRDSSSANTGDKDKTIAPDSKEEHCNMDFLFSKMKKSPRTRNGHKSSEGTSDSEKENQNMAEDDQAYTDLEDMAEETADPAGQNQNEAATTPRKRKSRPNKLIQAIQESVKRYERERQSIRQLHQIRRAQIYSGPTWDVALFRKIVDQYGKQVGQGGQGDGTPHSTSTTNALTWEEYLKEQLKVIQEERKSASTARKPNSAQPRESTVSASTENRPTPRNNARRPGESGSQDGKDRHNSMNERPVKQSTAMGSAKSQENRNSNSSNVNGNINNNNNNNNNIRNITVRGATAPPLRRAQTARGVRTAHPGENHQETTTAPLDITNHHDNPRWFTSREATRMRQEMAQQQLIKAYRPLAGMELFRNNNQSSLQPSRGWNRPQSTMSSRTSASGNSLANGRQSQSRGASRESDYSTIMTSGGSRRIRTPGPYGEANSTQPEYTRPRHSLIFKNVEEYEKPKRKLKDQQGER